LLFHCNNVCMNAPHCYVIRTLPVLLYYILCLWLSHVVLQKVERWGDSKHCIAKGVLVQGTVEALVWKYHTTKHKSLSFQIEGAMKTQAIAQARFIGKFWIHLPGCTTYHPTRLNAVRNQKALNDWVDLLNLLLSDTCAWIQILGGYKSGNSAPRGVKTCLYSKLYLCHYRVLQETKLQPTFRWFTSNGEGANTAEYKLTNTCRHERARLSQNKGNYSRHFEKVLSQNLVLFSFHQNKVFEKVTLGRSFYKMGSHGFNVPYSISWLYQSAHW